MPNFRPWYAANSAWKQLVSTLDPYQNSVSAPAEGVGIYALMTSIEVPRYGPGWNLVSYPLNQTLTITDALASIAGKYTTVYAE